MVVGLRIFVDFTSGVLNELAILILQVISPHDLSFLITRNCIATRCLACFRNVYSVHALKEPGEP